MPPIFPKAFYKALMAYAREFGVTRVEFAVTALRHYARELRGRNSPLTKALGSDDLAKQFAEARAKVARDWWAKLTPEERKERARRANKSRWPEKQKGK